MSDLATPADRKAAADHFWLRLNVPDLRGAGLRRVAIAEFVVEFVTAKRELTADVQEYLRAHPEIEKHAGGTVQNIALVYPNEYDFPARLHRILCQELTGRGLEVLPVAAVRAADAYRQFETATDGGEVDLAHSDAGVSDVGNVRRVSRRSLPGLTIIRGGGDRDPDAIAEKLRTELGADVVLRVRIRAGTFSGHATLERGSVIQVVAADVAGTILAERSLVSDESVIAESKQVVGGWQARVNLPAYDAALQAMFPAFIAMAFDSAESAPKLKR
jgi:hypothetical protein